MHEKFGAVLDAFEYGAPPHGGIALGIDRWAALLADQTNIREVMAFPKTQSGTDLMLEAPSRPSRASTPSWGCGTSGWPREAIGRALLLKGSSAPLDWFAQRPRLAALLGATCIAFSGVFYLYAAVSPFDRDVLPRGLRPAAARPRRVRRMAPLRPAAAQDDRLLAAIAGLFFTDGWRESAI